MRLSFLAEAAASLSINAISFSSAFKLLTSWSASSSPSLIFLRIRANSILCCATVSCFSAFWRIKVSACDLELSRARFIVSTRIFCAASCAFRLVRARSYAVIVSSRSRSWLRCSSESSPAISLSAWASSLILAISSGVLSLMAMWTTSLVLHQ